MATGFVPELFAHLLGLGDVFGAGTLDRSRDLVPDVVDRGRCCRLCSGVVALANTSKPTSLSHRGFVHCAVQHARKSLWGAQRGTFGKETGEELFDDSGCGRIVAERFFGLGEKGWKRSTKELLQGTQVTVPDLIKEAGVESGNSESHGSEEGVGMPGYLSLELRYARAGFPLARSVSTLQRAARLRRCGA